MDRVLIASLTLFVTSMVGCGRDKMKQPGPVPTEAARNALVGVLRDIAGKQSAPPGTSELFRELASPKYLADLERAVPQSQEEGVAVIGDWTCDCNQSSFTATFSSKHHLVTIDGAFAKDSVGTWKATVGNVTVNRKPEK